MARRIVLISLAKVDKYILEMLKASLHQTFNCPVTIQPQDCALDYAYDLDRKQYLASRLLASLRSIAKRPAEKFLGIVDVDLYAPGLNFVFGQADIMSGVALISLYRLQTPRYPSGNVEMFRERVTKEAVHELGHTYNLGHCPDRRCVMHFSNSLADTDMKETGFCPVCRLKLWEAGVVKDV